MAEDSPITPPQAELPRLGFTVRQVAIMLNCSEKSVYRLVERGLLHPVRALRHLLFTMEEIQRFLREN